VRSLGRFGRTYERIELDFDFFEATIRVNPSCSKAAVVEFLAEAGTVDQADEVRGAQLTMQLLREVIHPDDFERFWTIAKRERQDPEVDLMPIAQQVIEATSDFPTGQSSASGGGPVPTVQRFEVDLPSQDVPGLDPLTLQGLRITQNRPDLQVAVLRAGESRNGATASI
jgi:hypothetical protein